MDWGDHLRDEFIDGFHADHIEHGLQVFFSLLTPIWRSETYRTLNDILCCLYVLFTFVFHPGKPFSLHPGGCGALPRGVARSTRFVQLCRYCCTQKVKNKRNGRTKFSAPNGQNCCRR